MTRVQPNNERQEGSAGPVARATQGDLANLTAEELRDRSYEPFPDERVAEASASWRVRVELRTINLVKINWRLSMLSL